MLLENVCILHMWTIQRDDPFKLSNIPGFLGSVKGLEKDSAKSSTEGLGKGLDKSSVNGFGKVV